MMTDEELGGHMRTFWQRCSPGLKHDIHHEMVGLFGINLTRGIKEKLMSTEGVE